jgi:hypothetical protein
MKTCLLISGLPRQVEKCYENIKNSLILPNNPDIFVHTWANEETDTIKFIMENYKPLKMVYEPQKKFVNKNLDFNLMLSNYAIAYNRDRFIDMLYSSWYSAQLVNNIKEEYRLSNDVKYDYVIRARFDVTYNRPIIVSNYDPNQFNVNVRYDLPAKMTDDRIGFASNEIMNLYYSGFTLFEYLYKLKHGIDQIFCGETIVYEIMKHFNIKTNIINDFTVNVIR